MTDRVSLSDGLGRDFSLVHWAHASPTQRALALAPDSALRVYRQIVQPNSCRLDARHLLLSMSLPRAPLLRLGVDLNHDARASILDQLTRPRGLLLVPENFELVPCGVPSPRSGQHRSTRPANTSSGDSARWTQDRKMSSLHSPLRHPVRRIIESLAHRGFKPVIFFGWRSVEVQLEIYKKHHTKVKFSFHNAQTKGGQPDAFAADIIDERWAWSAAAQEHGFWKALGAEAKKQGLYWGGDWKHPDWAHVQLLPNSELKQVKKGSGL